MNENSGYTKEEQDKLTEVRKKMAKYLYTEIMPNIRRPFAIYLGKDTYDGIGLMKKCRILIYPDVLLVCYCSGMYKVLPDGTFQDSMEYSNYMTEQCMIHWAEIKHRCLEEVEECKEYKHTLDTFTV